MMGAMVGLMAPGVISHLAMEMFKARANLDMVHVPYKGSPQVQAALLAGEVQIMFDGALSLPHVRSGKIRALASSGRQRAQATPDLPTVSEAGLPGFDMTTWFGLAAPAGVPRPIIDKINVEVKRIFADKAFVEKNVTSRGQVPAVNTPEEFAAVPEMDATELEWEAVMCAGNPPPAP